MDTRTLERRLRDVRLGRRRFKLGPFTLEWGGGWYRVAPMSAAQTEQFQARAFEYLNAVSGSVAKLADVMLEKPTDTVRWMAPFFLDGPVKPRHLARASAEELEALAKAVVEVNDFPEIMLAMIKQTSLFMPAAWSAFATSTALADAPKEN